MDGECCGRQYVLWDTTKGRFGVRVKGRGVIGKNGGHELRKSTLTLVPSNRDRNGCHGVKGKILLGRRCQF